MDIRAGSIVMVLLLLPPPAAAAEPATLPADIMIRVHDAEGLPPGDLQRALDTAADVVSELSITAMWRVCSLSSAEPPALGEWSCRAPLAPRELVVRIVHARVDARHEAFLTLGNAMVDARDGSGVLATIYADRVRWMAREAGVDPWTLLGRALAHELGHLLMATTTHAPAGLMRATWLREELRRDDPEDWSFASSDAIAIRGHTSE